MCNMSKVQADGIQCQTTTPASTPVNKRVSEATEGADSPKLKILTQQSLETRFHVIIIGDAV